MSDDIIVRLPPIEKKEVMDVKSLAETVDWGLATNNISDLWRDSQGESIRAAVLDTGADLDHPDLAGAIVAHRDFSHSRRGSQDVQGHGTHVTGTIAARKNQQGVVGVAPLCDILVAKVLGDDGSGASSSVAQGVDWALSEDADIISMSLGSSQPSPVILRALERAVKAGKFVICAAGNDGRMNSVNYPARWNFAVAVGAVDKNGNIAKFSSRGEEVDICAPGQDVLSTFPGGRYARLSGTSMATPFVTGVVALMLSKHRRSGGESQIKTQKDLLDHLRKTAVDAGPQGKDPHYGYGLIDPGSVVASSDSDQPPPLVGSEVKWGPFVLNGVQGHWIFVPESVD